MKLEVNESSAKRRRRQLLPTPAGGRWSVPPFTAWRGLAALAGQPTISQYKTTLHTAVADEQELYEVVIVLSPGHFGREPGLTLPRERPEVARGDGTRLPMYLVPQASVQQGENRANSALSGSAPSVLGIPDARSSSGEILGAAIDPAPRGVAIFPSCHCGAGVGIIFVCDYFQ